MDWGIQQSTWMDVAIIIVLMGGIILGVSHGMIRQLLSLLGLFFGAALASQRHQDVAALLGFIGDPNWSRVISFAVIILAVLIAANIVGSVLARMLRLMMLGCLDSLGGGAIGAVESFFLVQVALILFYKYPILGVVKSIEESKVALQVLKLAPTVLALLPPEFDMAKQLLR